MRLAALLALLAVAAVAAAPCARQCAGPAPNGPCVVADFLGNATGAVAAYQLVALTAPLAVTWFGHVTYAAGALPSGTAFFSGTSAVFYPATGGGGSLMDMGGHCIDLLEMFFGKVSAVSCFTNSK